MKNFKMIHFFFLIASLFSCDKREVDPVDPVDPLPEITIFDVTQERDSVNTTTFRFFVNVSKPSDKIIKVAYATESTGIAVAGIDFIAASGVLSIPAGETLAFIDVSVPGKNVYEADEDFYVALSAPENAVITDNKATGIIKSNKSLQQTDPTGYTTPSSYPGYTLKWNDEFNGTSIDQNNWGYDLGASGWGNNELQNYTSLNANSYIANGSLVIEAIKGPNGNYTSARMITKGKRTFQYGRIDIRAKLPKGQGIWPALWMLGSNIDNVGWPACGEIDIMEYLGHQTSTVHGTAHWGAQGSTSSQSSSSRYDLTSGNFYDKFHVFSIIWEANRIRWYMDDQLFHTVTTTTTNGAANWRFNQEFFFIFNIAVGGNWPGYPDATTQFPQKMFVDYVRVFQ
ncbi:MAG: family 16 glycosylhydrolase [Bacteroidota bacterium]|jgi:beta-glucanase (GH16 family)|nr:family 16 glycosylhydrolase [Saprospiraceae bacterium]